MYNEGVFQFHSDGTMTEGSNLSSSTGSSARPLQSGTLRRDNDFCQDSATEQWATP